MDIFLVLFDLDLYDLFIVILFNFEVTVVTEVQEVDPMKLIT